MQLECVRQCNQRVVLPLLLPPVPPVPSFVQSFFGFRAIYYHSFGTINGIPVHTNAVHVSPAMFDVAVDLNADYVRRNTIMRWWCLCMALETSTTTIQKPVYECLVVRCFVFCARVRVRTRRARGDTLVALS